MTAGVLLDKLGVTRTVNGTSRLTVTQTAKLLRLALKREFGAQKFSVRSEKYAGGASINVNWTDGPFEPEVRAVTEQYAGARFDGMIDLKYHADHWLKPDGSAVLMREWGHSYPDTLAKGESRPEGALPVHFGADYIMTSRDISPDYRAELVAAINAHWGGEWAPNRDYNDGDGLWGSDLLWRYGWHIRPGGAHECCEGSDAVLRSPSRWRG